MKDKLKRFFNNKWVYGIIIGIVPTIITSFIANKNNISFSEGMKLFFNLLKNKVFDILNYKIPLWSVIISLIIFIISLFIIMKLKNNSNKKEHPDWYYKFRSIEHKEWVFTWEYSKYDYNNKYNIENLRPICKCKCELVIKDKLTGIYYREELKCPNCNNTYEIPSYSDLDDVKCLISHNINNCKVMS